MARIPGLRRVFRLATRRAPLQDDIDAELAFHFARAVEDLVARGLTPAAARAEAERRFGDVAAHRAELRAIDERRDRGRRLTERLHELAQDVRLAARTLRRTPGVTATIVLTLALGVGANSMMFGVVDRLLLRPPTYLADPARTGLVYLTRGGDVADDMSYATFRDVRDATRDMLDVAAVTSYSVPVGEGRTARMGRLGEASAAFWRMFEMRPLLGRWFDAAEDRLPNGSPVAVLGYKFWLDTGADSAALGKPVKVGDYTFTVIGVAPPGFTGLNLQPVDVWVPATTGGALDLGPTFADRYDVGWFGLLARRRAGVDRAAADARLAAAFQASERKRGAPATEVAQARAALYPTINERGPRRSDNARVTIWAAGVAVIVLVVACANVVNLLLVRATQRERETAVRLALGVSGGRLVKQLVVEALLLALLGAVAALLLAWLGRLVVTRVLIPDAGWGSNTVSAWQRAPVDARTLGVNGAVAIGSALLASLAPALHALRPNVVARLRGGPREGGAGAKHARLRGTLVLLQAALSVVLLVGAGLFVRSLQAARATPLGVDADRVTSVWVEMRGVKLDSTATAAMVAHLARFSRALPEVEAVGTTRSGHVGFTARGVRLPGGDTVPASWNVRDNVVGGDYLRAMGTRLLRGRTFETRDPGRDANSVVVSERLARRLWPGADPLGRCVIVGKSPVCRVVIGVVEDVRGGDPREPGGAAVYRPAAPTEGHGVGALVIRTHGAARAQTAALRRALQPEIPPGTFLVISPLADEVNPALRPWRLGTTLFVTFGVIGVLVAALGLYGALAYDVAQRRRDYGVRLALGALRGDVLRLVVRRGLGVALGGLALGLVLALAAGRAASSLLFGVSPYDPLTLGGVTALLAAVALAASLVPGWRAARVDPSTALRAD
jgi:predicted permease